MEILKCILVGMFLAALVFAYRPLRKIRFRRRSLIQLPYEHRIMVASNALFWWENKFR